MASVTTSEFVKSKPRAEAPPFSLLEHKGLINRLAEELTRAARDLLSNPRRFIGEMFKDENKDIKRRRLIYAGLGFALVAHFVFIGIIFIADWIKPQTKVTEPEFEVTYLDPASISPLKKPDDPKPDVPKGNSDQGGGGGGQHSLLPASGGVLPKIAPTPPLIKHDAPEKNAPILAVDPNLLGPESISPPADSTIGVPTGSMDAPPSPGTGSGGGLGEGRGSGIGPGSGPGSGPGTGGNKGGDQYGSPNGTGGPGTVPYSRISQISNQPGYSPFRWIYRPTPVVTAEAQERKIAGTVLLRATFHADGRITDIEIVSPVEFMTESAIAALMKSKYKPASVNGQPITLTRVPVRIEVHYGANN